MMHPLTLPDPREVAALKPCPFCGGASHPVRQRSAHWIVCDAEDCCGVGPVRVTADLATAAWNRRAHLEPRQ